MAELLELWVDDCKPAPEGLAVARNYDDAIGLLRRHEYAALYLDHDLGDTHRPERTGYDLLKQLIAEGRVPPRVECISWNPVGVKRINDLIATLPAHSLTPSEETPNER